MEVCPSDLLLAPADRIWHLLTEPRKVAQWTGTKLVEGGASSVSAGDHFTLRAGVARIIFDVVDVHAPRQLTLAVRLPFGVAIHEKIQITPIDAQSSRVTFN